MRYVIFALFILAMLIAVVWQFAVTLIALGVLLFKAFFVVWTLVVFWAGYKLKGWIDERRLQKTFKMS